VTGAWGAVRIDGREVDPYEAHPWPAGTELHLDWYAHGARAYLAVRGGIDARTALGSRATDLLAGLGPTALRPGDVVGVRDDAIGPIPVAPPGSWSAPHDDELELELAPGPRADWFAPAALETLYDSEWTASHHAARVGGGCCGRGWGVGRGIRVGGIRRSGGICLSGIRRSRSDRRIRGESSCAGEIS
jgi:allophanate hydrolase subunit 2